MKYEVKSVEIWRVGRTVFMISLVVLLVLGVGGLLIILIGMNIAISFLDDTVYFDDEMMPESFGLPIGLILIIVISFGASFFCSALYVAIAALYNLFSGWLGGIEITLKESTQPVKTILIPKADDVSEEDKPEE